MTLTYTELLNETIDIYLTGNYRKAYEFITKNSNGVNGNLAQIYNFRYAIASKAGEKNLALTLMEESIVDHGFWYAVEYLKSDEDLDSLRKENKFDFLLSICEEREKEAQKACEGKMELLTTEDLIGKDKNQLIIALHGNQESNDISKYYWKDALNSERIIALIQSSEIEFSNAYNWNDLNKGKKVIEIFQNKIKEEIKFNEGEVILAGFSAGGRQVLHHILFTEAKVKGLILIAPWLPELDAWKTQLSVLKNKETKVYIICGHQDEDSFDDSKKLSQYLSKKQIEYEFLVIENLSHDYPNDFLNVIEKAIQYINA